MRSVNLVLVLGLLGACAGEEVDPGQAELGHCEAATREGVLAELSCVAGAPVDPDGVSAVDLGLEPAALPDGAEPRAAVRQYDGPCTGIWYGCSRVVAEGWEYTVCGSSLWAWMKFQGAYGNLVGWGTGYCWF